MYNISLGHCNENAGLRAAAAAKCHQIELNSWRERKS